MKKYMNYTFISFIMFTSCYNNSNERNYENQFLSRKFTKSEELFIKSLKLNKYQNVKLYIPIIGHGEYRKSTCTLDAKPNFVLNINNADSIIEIRKNLYIQLYSNALSDSNIFDCYLFNVNFDYSFNKINDINLFPKTHPNLFSQVNKRTLEKWSGFKVIKDQNGNYKRVALKKKP